jgi:hypothetical protein
VLISTAGPLGTWFVPARKLTALADAVAFVEKGDDIGTLPCSELHRT